MCDCVQCEYIQAKSKLCCDSFCTTNKEQTTGSHFYRLPRDQRRENRGSQLSFQFWGKHIHLYCLWNVWPSGSNVTHTYMYILSIRDTYEKLSDSLFGSGFHIESIHGGGIACKTCLPRGIWGQPPPGKFLKTRCSETDSGGTFAADILYYSWGNLGWGGNPRLPLPVWNPAWLLHEHIYALCQPHACTPIFTGTVYAQESLPPQTLKEQCSASACESIRGTNIFLQHALGWLVAALRHTGACTQHTS